MSIKIHANGFLIYEHGASRSLLVFLLTFFLMSSGYAGNESKVLDGFNQVPGKLIARADQLPVGVRRMHQELLGAVKSGDMEQMRVVLEISELMPLINGQFIRDPVKHWQQRARDGSGREVLAQLSEILELPPVKIMMKQQAFYIWPYFAHWPLDKLSARELVRLYRLAPATKTALMLKNNHYTHTQIMLGADGTLHSMEIPRERLSKKSPQKP